MRLRSFYGVSRWVAVLALLSIGASAPARALTTLFEAWVVFEEAGLPVWLPITVTETVNGAGDPIGVVNNWQCTTACAGGGFSIVDLNLMLDPDPVISFGTSVIDFGGPSAFGFVFQQTIVPTAAPGIATSSFSGSTTNGGGSAGSVTVTPLSPPAGIGQDGPDQAALPDEMMVYSLSTNGGATWLNAGLDLGPKFVSNPGLVSDGFGPFNEGPVAGPAGVGVYDKMRVDVNFSLPGGNDVFTFNGDATIVPEPATALQVALGLLGLAIGGRRRRN